MDDATLSFESDQTIVLEAPSATRVHRIDIAFHRYGPKGTYYRVAYCGETLIESAREPVYSSCRVLVARGLTGCLEVWFGKPYPIGIVRDIAKGAKLTIVETETEGPRLARYRPHPHALARGQERDAIADAIAAAPF
jgi:hypothetical protein